MIHVASFFVSMKGAHVDLAVSIGNNVARIRAELGWSQRDLAAALAANGPGWTRQTVGMLEVRGVRAERLQDLVQLCETLQVPLSDLLEGDTQVDFRHGRSVGLAWLRRTLDGQYAERPSTETEQQLASGIGEDDRDETARMAKAFGVTVDVLQGATRELSGQDSPTRLRDFLAQLEPSMSRNEARARRGHATRRMKRELVDGELISSFDQEQFKSWLSQNHISSSKGAQQHGQR